MNTNVGRPNVEPPPTTYSRALLLQTSASSTNRPHEGTRQTLRNHEIKRILLFVGVNGVGTALDVTSVFLLMHAYVMPLAADVLVGWSLSQTCGYLLNRRFVFQDGDSSPTKSLVRYGALVALNLLVGVGMVSILVDHGWNYLLTRVLSSIILVFSNFFIARHWVFRVATIGSEVHPKTVGETGHF